MVVNGDGTLAYEFDCWDEMRATYNPEQEACAWEGELAPETYVLAVHRETETPGVYRPHRFLTVDRLTEMLEQAGITRQGRGA